LLQGQPAYLSPEDVEHLRNGTKRLELGVSEHTELFSIGLTMLSAGILQNNIDLYDINKMIFNKTEFIKRINFWLTRQRYS
jgi:hypothetical protein